jgi:Na+-exporting ATPase
LNAKAERDRKRLEWATQGNDPNVGIQVMEIETADPKPTRKRRRRFHFSLAGLFSREVLMDTLVYGIFIGIVSLPAFLCIVYIADGFNTDGCNDKYSSECDSVFRARTVTFVMLSIMLLLHAYNCRHPRQSILSQSWFDNKLLVYSVLIGVLVVVPTPYIPYLNKEILRQAPISWGEWCLFFNLAELYKLCKRRWMKPLSRPVLMA